MLEQPPQVEEENKAESYVKAEKGRAWENKIKELDEVGDALGEGIDEHIKGVVAAFNLNELNTDSSCHGHTDWGYAAPWVGIEAPDEPEERYINQKKIFEDTALKYGVSFEDVKRANKEEAWIEAISLSEKNGETDEYKIWREENKKLLRKVEEFLNEFYKYRKVENNLRLGIEMIGGNGSFRVHNGGKDYMAPDEMNAEQKNGLEERLLKYRAEMKEFGNFMKEKFFQS